ncbi:della protein rgl1 [Quercus suber]|uniref:Della protein rgl1 n=1 Tax=Quercus suber TaxID=58331 RepID=A0AAW0LJ82_QUESU
MCLSARACYPYQYLPISDNSDSTLDLPFPEETRDRKKLKRSISIADSMDSYSSQSSDGINFCTYNRPSISRTGSFNNLSKLQFRDHIWTCNQRYLAAEAVEEAAEAIINAEESDPEEDESADGMRLVRLLFGCAEAVACRDRSHASALLSQLRACALFFGSSFQPRACYPYQYLPISDNSDSTLDLPFPEETRDRKKLKRSISIADSMDSYSSQSSDGINFCTYNRPSISRTGSFNNLSKLQFRDHIWTCNQRYLAAEAVEEAAEAIINAEESDPEEDESADGMRLVRLLFGCAEAVACRDRSHASALLSQLRACALFFGSSFQRVPSCFVKGLAERLCLVQPLGGGLGFATPPMMNIMDIKIAHIKIVWLSLVFENCPHIRFGHFVANETILEAFEGDGLGMTLGLAHGHQWRALINSLANRADQPPCRLQITSVGLAVDRFQTIGVELMTLAESMGINFEFSVVESNLENLQPEDNKLFDGEVLVVNSILQLHCVVKESRGALNSVLQIIHKLSAKVLVLVEQESSHNGPFFLGRFMEALHYYSAIFDSLDTT